MHPNALKYLHFYSKTRAKNYHPAGRSWPAGLKFETPGLEPTLTAPFKCPYLLLICFRKHEAFAAEKKHKIYQTLDQ